MMRPARADLGLKPQTLIDEDTGTTFLLAEDGLYHKDGRPQSRT
jgi:hypothetical protein